MAARHRLLHIDHTIAQWMHRHGHRLHRVPLALLFLWFGLLKLFGQPTATSLIAKTVYLGDPAVTVPILGAWEAAIGVCLLWKPLFRLGVLLLAVRLPGTAIARFAHMEVCWVSFPLVPTAAGAYLIKDLVLIGAAIVIGGTVHREPPPGHHH